MKNGKILVGITHGDINGVGYETILKLFSEPMMLELCTPIIYGSPKVATYHRKALELTTNFVTIQQADEAVDGRLNLVDCLKEEVKIEFGQLSAESGKAAFFALEKAIADYREGLFDVLVTAPITTHIYRSNIKHTNLQKLSNSLLSKQWAKKDIQKKLSKNVLS